MAEAHQAEAGRGQEKGMIMILSYLDLGEEMSRRVRVRAKITTQNAASSSGQPVIVLEDGEILDLTSWVNWRFRVVKASKREWVELARIGISGTKERF